MKALMVGLMVSSCLSLHGSCGEAMLPDQPMGKQLEWAEAAKTDLERAKRLEAFWKEYLPKEDGGVSIDRTGYNDGSHVSAVVHCAWQLTRAYISTGQKEKALAMVNWLAEHESKTALAPVIETPEPDGTAQPATRPESESGSGDKQQP